MTSTAPKRCPRDDPVLSEEGRGSRDETTSESDAESDESREVLQAAGSQFSGSLAVLFDCGHLLCDVCGLLAVLAASRVAARSPTPVMTFGFQRAEVVCSLVSVQQTWLVCGLLVYAAAARVASLHYEDLDPDLMIVSALLGFAGNLLKLPRISSSYKFSHATKFDQKTPFFGVGGTNSRRPTRAPLLRVSLLHAYGDVTLTASVLVAALVIRVQVGLGQ
ncbi:zinc transporter 4-like [Hyalella azteca]|uniref:Zinc transporter 4-like n=1 Tax=Hyalella azteca TaxID=294128 RepID=A0A8B7PSG6_HYAAZ|nr:zinc transporter 4-like [Hyalella azteca]